MGCAASRTQAPAPGVEPRLHVATATVRLSVLEADEHFKRALQAAHANKELPAGGPPAADEARRIKALRQVLQHPLDPGLRERLTAVVELMRATFCTDYAALSLIDADRQIYVAKAGVAQDLIDSADRQTAFGSWALEAEHAQMIVVEDTLEDARFAGNALVMERGLRFCAGAPLLASDGAGAYGMLLVADRTPRKFAVEQLAVLTGFAELCCRKLEEARLAELQQKQEAAVAGTGQKLVRDLSALSEAVLAVNCATDSWVIEWANNKFYVATGVPLDAVVGADVWGLFRPQDSMDEMLTEANAAIFLKKPFTVAATLIVGGAEQHLTLNFRPAAHGVRSGGIPMVGIPAFVSSKLDGAAGDSKTEALKDMYFATLTPPGAATAGGHSPHLAAGTPRSASGTAGGQSGLSTPGGQHAACLTCMGSSRDRERVFEDVKLGPPLGAGAYGRVYRALWRGAEVAVKVMDFYCEPLKDGMHHIGAEKHSALLEALLGIQYARHPNLVQTFDLGLRPSDGASGSDSPGTLVRHQLWVVMELCNRGSLNDAVVKGRFRLQPTNPASEPNMLSILLTAQEIAGGMTLLHDAGIMHSDMSGSNVMLRAAANSRRFTAVVSDYGLSRVCLESDGRRTETVGTVTHQPPELLAEGLASPAGDVYAFGVLLHSMYTGQLPYEGEHPTAVIHQVVSSERCPLELPATAPEGFKELLEACMSYDRARRPSFRAVLAALEPLVEAAEAEAPPPPSPRSPGLGQLRSSSFTAGASRLGGGWGAERAAVEAIAAVGQQQKPS